MSAPRYDVVGLGNAIVDVIARIDDATLSATGMAKGSMTLVDLDASKAVYDRLGETVERSGGSAANTIAGLAALGRRTAFIGKVRDDQFGEVFAHDIRASGCTYNTAPATSGEETARCMVMVSPDAERTMATYLGISTAMGPGDLDAGAIVDGAILYLEGYLWDRDEAKEAFRQASRIARDAGRKVALTLSDSFCVDRHRDSFLDLISEHVDIVFANEGELLSLYQTEDFDAAFAMLSGKVETVAVTRSEKGAVVGMGGQRVDVAAADVSTLVDLTGAGDLFAAGFLNGLTQGKDAETCGRMGCVAASVVIQQIGARCEDALVARFKVEDLA